MTQSDPLAEIERAFSAGQNQHGLALLRELNSSAKASPLSLNQQAVIEEQIGDWNLAGRAHLACVEAAPHVASAYLYAAYWLQKSNLIDAAAALYSLAQEADPSILNGPPTDPKKHERAMAGQQLLAQYLQEHHRAVASGCSRIEAAHWVQSDHRRHLNSNRGYQPQLFSIPDLSQTPYHSCEHVGWAKALEAKVDEVEQELITVLQQQGLLRPYLQDPNSVPHNMKKLAGSDDWSALDLYKEGQINQKAAKNFPKTLAALKEVPTYNLTDSPFEVFFSILKPGQSIPPHFGQSNHSLNVHLPIAIPKQCYLEVGGEKHTWHRGELVVFDDNFQHSAHNGSNENRIVLIFHIWHPDLNSNEQTAVQASFQARQNWMATRRDKLHNLIQ